MNRIFDFSRTPAKRNYTIADLQALNGSGRKLSMANPANADEVCANEKNKFLEALDKAM